MTISVQLQAIKMLVYSCGFCLFRKYTASETIASVCKLNEQLPNSASENGNLRCMWMVVVFSLSFVCFLMNQQNARDYFVVAFPVSVVATDTMLIYFSFRDGSMMTVKMSEYIHKSNSI